jgi:molecular chaperone DnaK
MVAHMATKRPVLGIDFGTTNTSAAWVDSRGGIQMVPVTEVDTALPSVIWWASKDKFVVGAGARERLLDDPTHTIFGFKRFLGRNYKSEFVNRIKDRFPYNIVEGDDGTAAVEVHGQVRTTKDLAFHVIHRMVELANVALGQDVDECVMSVPSHYGYRQRQFIRTAAEMAGLDVRAIVNEPTAAALYFSRQHAPPRTAMVFDLGGGTFDVTLIQVQGSLVKVLASGGDAFLGGADFDERIAATLARRFEQENGVIIQNQKVVMQRLIFASETAKMLLSSEESARVRLLFAAEKNGRPIDLEYPLTRDLLEMIIAPLIERSMAPCDELLKKAGMKHADVDELILVGRQTRTPALRRRLYTQFKGDPNRSLRPELAVPSGAALLGSLLDDIAGAPLIDVVSIPIWVMVPGAGPKLALGANTAVPSVGRLALDALPNTGAPVVLWMYEALDAAAVDREMLGSVKIEAAFLAANPGPVTLEVTMMQNFSMEVAVRGHGGAREKLVLTPPKAKK